jgi:MerR, DNA binding
MSCALLALADQRDRDCGEVDAIDAIARQHPADVEGKIADLTALADELRSVVGQCQNFGMPDHRRVGDRRTLTARRRLRSRIRNGESVVSVDPANKALKLLDVIRRQILGLLLERFSGSPLTNEQKDIEKPLLGDGS